MEHFIEKLSCTVEKLNFTCTGNHFEEPFHVQPPRRGSLRATAPFAPIISLQVTCTPLKLLYYVSA